MHAGDILLLQEVGVAASKNQTDDFDHKWEWVMHKAKTWDLAAAVAPHVAAHVCDLREGGAWAAFTI